MSSEIEDKWNARYHRGENRNQAPLDVVARAARLPRPGKALDLACGLGRHALLLGEMGWHVTAVDASSVAIEIVKEQACARGLTIDARVADLERDEFTIAPGGYDLICDCFYLQRDLFAQIQTGVRGGGLVVAAIPLMDDAPGSPPMNPAYLLARGELAEYFAGWEIIHFAEDREGANQRLVAELIARRPA